MDNRQNNQDFTLVSAPGQSLSGNANKIKLKMVSYAAILEVQATFMEEEGLKKQEEWSKNIEEVKSVGPREEIKDALIRSAKLSKELTDMQVAFEELEDYNAKFMDMAKKALKLPNANLEELVATGKTTLDGKVVTKEDISKDIDISSVVNLDNAVEKGESVLKTPDNKSIFSDIDSDEIRRQVEEVINSDEKVKDGLTFTDYVDQKVNDDKTFDTAVSFLAGESKDELDDKIANPEFEADDLKNMFDEEPEVATVNDNTDTKDNSSVLPTIDFSNIFDSGSAFADEEAAFVEPKDDKEEKENAEIKSVDSVSTVLGSISFEDDEELKNILTQQEEARKSIGYSKDDVKKKQQRVDETAREREEKKAKAGALGREVEAVRINVRNEEIAKQKRILAELLEQASNIKAEANKLDETIKENEDAIASYDEEIAKSQSIIEQYGGRTK